MPSNQPFRVAVIGLGAVTRNIHLPGYKALGRKIEVVAGCDPDAAARALARDKFGVPAVFETPEKMLAETAPDIVAVCTPPALHVEQSLLALEHGAHVFCEKPLAESLADADRLIAAAEAKQRTIVVNNQFPYMNIHRAAKAAIGSPEFGRLLFLQAWQVFHPDEMTEADWRGRLKRRLGFEFGIHVFSLVRYFFDEEPVALTAQMPNPLGGFKTDALNLVTLEFADGRAASIVLNRLSHAPERYLDMRLDGERATVSTSIGGELGIEAGLHARQRTPFFGLNFVKGGKAVLQQGTRAKILAKDGLNPFASSTGHHFNNFVEALENGTVPPGAIADNRKTLALVFAAYDAAESRATIDLTKYGKAAAASGSNAVSGRASAVGQPAAAS